MPKIDILQVDAFTTVPQTGNPAGVVLDGRGLSEKQMQMVAREMNVSETAFILPATKEDADLRIRWFTPQTEVPLCGHATVASFHALAEGGHNGMKKDGSYSFRLETASGVLPIEIVKDAGVITVMMGLKVPVLERVMHYKIDLVRVLNITLSEFENRMPISRGDYLLVPVKRLHTLFTLKPNLVTMSNFLDSRNLHGLCIFTTETVDRGSAVHSRFFAPNQGINEDPVTGSAHGPLAVHLYENGFLEPQAGRCVFQGEQGDPIGRKGRVSVELLVENNRPVSVRIGGNAVTTLHGWMQVQD